MTRSEFEAVIEEMQPRLVKFAASIVGKTAADDVAQAGVLNVFESNRWRELSDEELPAYLITSVENAAKDHLKAEQRRHEHEAGYAARRDVRTPDESALLQKIDVDRQLATLPEAERAAVIAVVVEGQTTREHAEDAGISQRTANRLVQRGIERLRGSNPSSASLQEVPQYDNDEEVA